VQCKISSNMFCVVLFWPVLWLMCWALASHNIQLLHKQFFIKVKVKLARGHLELKFVFIMNIVNFEICITFFTLWLHKCSGNIELCFCTYLQLHPMINISTAICVVDDQTPHLKVLLKVHTISLHIILSENISIC